METGPLGKRGLFLCGLRLSEQERLIHEDEKKIRCHPMATKMPCAANESPWVRGQTFYPSGMPQALPALVRLRPVWAHTHIHF